MINSYNEKQTSFKYFVLKCYFFYQLSTFSYKNLKRIKVIDNFKTFNWNHKLKTTEVFNVKILTFNYYSMQRFSNIHDINTIKLWCVGKCFKIIK